MDQTANPVEKLSTPQDTPQQKGFFKRRRVLVIVAAFFAVIFVAFFAVILAGGWNNRSEIPKKTWEVVFTYNPSDQKFALDSLTLLEEEILMDYRSAKYSEYELQYLNKDGEKIYVSKVPVVTYVGEPGLLLNPPVNPEKANEEPIKNILYVPYFEEGAKIIIQDSEEQVLELNVPQKNPDSTFNLPKFDAYAQNTCSPLTVVFVSDNYTDFEQYHRDVEVFKQAFLSTKPFSSKTPSIFDFKVVDNAQPFECASQGLKYCISNNATQMVTVAKNAHPAFSKVVVIANTQFLNPKDGGAVGIAHSGGFVSVFPNNYGDITSFITSIAQHEFLGHSVSSLNDRYVSKDPRYGINANNNSNCADSPEGAAFWKDVGTPLVTQGCSNQNLYAPAPLTCPSGSNPNLISGGNRETLMSSAGCGGSQFDQFEKEWIIRNILPDYTGCEAGQTPVPPPVSTSRQTSRIQPTSKIERSITGTVYNDVNASGAKDSGESGVPNATLNLSGPAGGTKVTDTTGTFRFDTLPEGSYTLTFSYPGIISSTKDFVFTSNISSFTYDIGLQGLASGTPEVSNPNVTKTPTISVPSGSLNPTSRSSSPAGSGRQLFTCVPDSRCANNATTIQLCPLICSPQ